MSGRGEPAFARWWHGLYGAAPAQPPVMVLHCRPLPVLMIPKHVVRVVDVTTPPPSDRTTCSSCGAWLLFSARQRGNGMCGPCTRGEVPLLCLRVADEAHRSRARARRNGRGRSRAAAKRRAAHVARCPWCAS